MELKDTVQLMQSDDYKPKSTYNMQLKAMSEYIAVLEARAAIEQIAVWR